ncbi:hypothetical protein BGZ49_010024 [Haplosporangium sp. Z 27]|nr:hypothetical protein BGZ49_010024 [Haplosporangium sp. Z 27]
MEELQDMQLKDLTIRLSTIPQRLTILEPLLRHCPLLERLKLYDLFDRSTIQQVVQVLEDNSCPQLRHLFLSDVVCLGEDDVAVDMIRAVMGCKGGDSGAGDNRIKASNKGLQSYELYNNSHFTPQCARALVEFHAGTLTALDLSVSYLVNFSVFIQVVGSLPNLVSLIASIRLRSKGEMDTEKTETALQSTWSCAGLKTIHLSVMYRHQYSASSDGELVDRCAAYLLEQIGRQPGLQELRLEGSILALIFHLGQRKQNGWC